MLPAEPAYVDSLWEEYADIDVADIVVDIEAPDLNPSYTYRVPEALRGVVAPGLCVHVPFHGREALGYVLERRKLPSNAPLARKLKDIIAVIEDAIAINGEQLHAVRWMSEHYVCDLLDAIRCVAPASLGSRVAAVVRLADSTVRGSDIGESILQAHIVETLRALDGEAELETLRDRAQLPNFSSAYSALLEKGVVVETRRVTRARTVGKKSKGYRLGAAAEVLTGPGSAGRRSPQQQRLINALVNWSRIETRPMPQDELIKTAQASVSSLKGLIEKGLVEASELTLRRAPVSAAGPRTVAPVLSPGQQQATELLKECLHGGETRTVLLFGVTASGKTEVYLNAIAETLALGKSAIVLLPEIALTAQVVDVFVGRFGEQVAVLHSRLSEGERHDEWRRMQAGQARIVVGARSAIFAPVGNVGLIVVDEEHEASYKQENTPRYNAKDLAEERARLSSAILLLGSATPSLESYYAATERSAVRKKRIGRHGSDKRDDKTQDTAIPGTRDQGTGNRESKWDDKKRQDGAGPGTVGETRNVPSAPATLLIEMRQRIDDRPLPKVELVDLREEFKVRRALFSQRLTDAIAERLAHKQQTILFLNRRGYAQFVLCRDCGWAAKCPNCAVSLAYHAYERSLKCHHCDYMGPTPLTCPDCGSIKVKAFGIGTEKVEEEVNTLFPSARVARMDRDTTAAKGAHGRILRDFRQGDADILIGTQMVAKGLDFPNVTLVGVISADTGINMPDFRAAERTFQVLTQVAGRAGRGVTPGEVIIQTFSPDHYAIQAAIQHDYVSFYRQEILFREELKYPPFARFANLICSAAEEAKARSHAERLAAALGRVVPETVEIIGPSPAPIARLKNLFRHHVALRAPVDADLSHMIQEAVASLAASDRQGISIDIDPLSMA